MHQGRCLGRRGRRLAVQVVLQDRGDAPAAQRTDRQRPRADRLRPLLVGAPEQLQNALAAPVTLLGMPPVRQDRGDQGLGRGAELPRPAKEVLGAPLGKLAVTRRHVIAQRGRRRPGGAARMGRDPAASPEHLDRARAQPHLDLLADQRVRNRVGGTRDLDVIVEPDPHPQPFGVLVGGLGQRVQDRPVEPVEQLTPAHPQPAQRLAVEPLQGGGDLPVAVLQREEGLSPQPAQQPQLNDPDAGLDLRLVLWLQRPGRQNADPVVLGHPAVAPVQLGIVEVRPLHARLQIVRVTCRSPLCGRAS